MRLSDLIQHLERIYGEHGDDAEVWISHDGTRGSVEHVTGPILAEAGPAKGKLRVFLESGE